VVELGGDPARTAAAVAALRDHESARTTRRWRGRLAGSLDLGLLHHLTPPDELQGAAAQAGQWRRRYSYASCYYRQGPGFILVKDRRDPSRAARFVLDEADMIALFTRCLAPTSVRDMSARERDLVQDLQDERLLLRCKDIAVVLPIRMRRWPVPFNAV
jgi:hypothetical protein